MKSTIIVAGAPRTGTSLIAGTLHTLGVSMGEKWVNDEGTYEDIDFTIDDANKIADTIWLRNQKYDNWGFKWPLSYKYMWQISSQLKNPKVVFAYRNIVKLRQKRPNISISRHLKILGFWGAFLEVYNYPTLFIDYDDAISKDPKWLVDTLIEFCEIQPNENDIKKAIEFNTKGEGYKVTKINKSTK